MSTKDGPRAAGGPAGALSEALDGDRLDPILAQGAPLVAHVTRVTATRTTRLITVQCPLCGREHTHGWPYGHDEAGHRVAHCRGRWGYFIRGAE